MYVEQNIQRATAKEMCPCGWSSTWLSLTAVILAVVVISEDVQEEGRLGSEPVMAAYRAGENNGCTSVRFAYGGKGFSHHDVPLSMITGQCTF